MANRFRNRTIRIGNILEPGSGPSSFLAGMGSVIHLIPGVVNPVYDTVYQTGEWITPESADGVLIHNYWEWVGADLAAAIDETTKVA